MAGVDDWIVRPLGESMKAEIRRLIPQPPCGADHCSVCAHLARRLVELGYINGSAPVYMADDILRALGIWGPPVLPNNGLDDWTWADRLAV